MRILLIAAGLALTATSISAFAAKGSKLVQDGSLYSSLKTRFEDSTTAYPIESYLQTSAADVSSFAGCSLAGPNGEVRDLKEGLVFFNYRVSSSKGHGPIDPTRYVTSISFSLESNFRDLFTYGAIFHDGLVDFDTAQFNQAQVPGCFDNTTVLDTWKNGTYESLPAESKFTGLCNNGDAFLTLRFRQSDDYIVSKSVRGLNTNYGYCWKK